MHLGMMLFRMASAAVQWLLMSCSGWAAPHCWLLRDRVTSASRLGRLTTLHPPFHVLIQVQVKLRQPFCRKLLLPIWGGEGGPQKTSAISRPQSNTSYCTLPHHDTRVSCSTMPVSNRTAACLSRPDHIRRCKQWSSRAGLSRPGRERGPRGRLRRSGAQRLSGQEAESVRKGPGSRHSCRSSGIPECFSLRTSTVDNK